MVKGIYVLIISLNETRSLKVGSLGLLTFEKGFYAYVGSAQNDLEKRIARHLRRQKKFFWHIDYLLSDEHAKIINVFFKEAQKSEECKLAWALSGIYKPIRGFGSSDCRCPSHLFRINDHRDVEALLKELGLNSFLREGSNLRGVAEKQNEG